MLFREFIFQEMIRLVENYHNFKCSIGYTLVEHATFSHKRNFEFTKLNSKNFSTQLRYSIFLNIENDELMKVEYVRLRVQTKTNC